MSDLMFPLIGIALLLISVNISLFRIADALEERNSNDNQPK